MRLGRLADIDEMEKGPAANRAPAWPSGADRRAALVAARSLLMPMETCTPNG